MLRFSLERVFCYLRMIRAVVRPVIMGVKLRVTGRPLVAEPNFLSAKSRIIEASAGKKTLFNETVYSL